MEPVLRRKRNLGGILKRKTAAVCSFRMTFIFICCCVYGDGTNISFLASVLVSFITDILGFPLLIT